MRRRSFHAGPASAVRGAFTLLEIILSLAILAGALVVLGEIMRLADQQAGFARDETEAEILAASVMDEMLSGARQPAQVSKKAFDFETEKPWVYSVTFEPTKHPEVTSVAVRVELGIESQLEPAHYEMRRWILAPEYKKQLQDQEAEIQAQIAAQEEAEAQAAQAAANTAATGGGAQQGGTQQGGGQQAGGGGQQGGGQQGGGQQGGGRGGGQRGQGQQGQRGQRGQQGNQQFTPQGGRGGGRQGGGQGGGRGGGQQGGGRGGGQGGGQGGGGRGGGGGGGGGRGGGGGGGGGGRG